MAIDIDGLTVAFLDDSGQIEHWLDVETGDIVEFPASDAESYAEVCEPRFRRIPTRTAESESEDRRAFILTLKSPREREELSRAIGVPEAYRRVLHADRLLERAWFNFKNNRALAAIEAWLRDEGLS